MRIVAMARGGASIQSGSVYHVISRFVAKEWFVESATERRMYLSLLGLAIAQTDWQCFCYAVMSSHIHLGLLAGTCRLRDWLRPMHTSFAQWMNLRRERIGAVFVRGPNVVQVDPAGTGALINYVHCNPVRAGVVNDPSNSDWTSHRAYVGLARRPPWLAVDCGLGLAGFESERAFAEWVANTRTGRAELEAIRLTPRPVPGRPRHTAADPSKTREPVVAGSP
ncbi:MAG TPA: hypothetical protein VIV40_40165 [Kofleriaceae bacterium]